jgi:hypothetical protein
MEGVVIASCAAEGMQRTQARARRQNRERVRRRLRLVCIVRLVPWAVSYRTRLSQNSEDESIGRWYRLMLWYQTPGGRAHEDLSSLDTTG